MRTKIWSMEDRVTAECECGCCEVQFTKQTYGDAVPFYNISIADSYYDHNPNSLIGRLRRAFGILFGKPVYFNDACLYPEDFDALLTALEELRDNDSKESAV